jgi:hypothetical protein
MEMSQGNTLYSYLKQTKMPFFIQKQRTGKQNRSCLGGGYQWEGGGYKERGSEGEYGANNLYTYVNGKMITVEIIPGIKNDGGGEFN